MKSLFKFYLFAILLSGFNAQAQVARLDLCGKSALLESVHQFENRLSSIEWQSIPKKTLSYGYTDKALAVFISRDCLQTITNNYKQPIISIRYPLSEVRIYTNETGKLVKVKTIGEVMRGEPEYPESRSHHFSALELPKTGDIYLVATSETSLQMPITAESMGELITHRETDSWMLAIHYGLLIMLGAFALFVGILKQDKFFIGISSFAFGLTFVLSSMNWLPQTFIPSIPYFFRIRLVPIGGALFFVALAKMLVLTEEKINKSTPFKKVYNSMIWIGVALIACSLTLNYQYSVIIAHASLVAATLMIVADLIHFTFSKRRRENFCIPLVPIPSLLGLVTVSLKSVGIIPSTQLFNYFPQLGAVITVLVIGRLTVRVFIKELKVEEREKQNVAISKKVAEQAKLVAHDIRSPLAALKTIETDLATLPEGQRKLIRNAIFRISDIANGLLNLSNQHKSSTVDQAESVLLLPIFDGVISELRASNANQEKRVHIELKCDAESAFAHVTLAPSSFRRAISNLLNNAVEASPYFGTVTVSLKHDIKRILVEITDEGQGFPTEMLDQLGVEGFSTKENGNGLGIFQARQAVKQADGAIHFRNRETGGAVVNLILPISNPPSDAVMEVVVPKSHTIVAIDDDESLLQAWRNKAKESSHEFYGFNSSEHLKNAISHNRIQVSKSFFIVDYDLGRESGMNLIDTFQIQDRCILVTSYYDDPDIRSRSKKRGFKILSKSLLAYLSIKPIEENPGMVLLDDDAIVRDAWKAQADKLGLPFVCFRSDEELFGALESITKDSLIYVDVTLKDGKSGVEAASKLIEMGYANVSLATGFQPNDLPIIPGLKSVVGKEFPKIVQTT